MGKIKISALDIYTGTLPADRFPSSLPAANGSALTNLDASNLSSGTVNAARLPLAESTTRGAVVVGSNLTLTSGTISLTSSNVTAALTYTPVNPSVLGQANGIATLDANSLVTAAQLPTGTTSVKGVLSVGSNISVASGAISLSSGNVTGALGFTPADAAKVGAVNGIASLDASGLVPVAQLPAIAVTDTFEVASQSAMLALVAQKGDIAIRSDLNKCFILADSDASVLANWKELKTPTDAVLSVNGQTGAVSLSTSNITEGTNLYWSNDKFDTRLGSASLNAANLTGTVPLSSISGITNSQISASAEIADSKLATISSAGKVSNSATTATSANTNSAIVARDASGNFAASQITVSADPTTSLQVATKQYVDAKETSATSALSAETTARQSADTALGTRISARPFAQMVVLGDLAGHASDGGTHDFFLNTDGAKTIRKIAVTCPTTPASGTIVVDVKLVSTQGGAATSLFPSKTKPTITCANGVAWVVLSGTSLDTVAVPDNAVLTVTVVSAAAASTDLRIEIFE